MEKAEATEPTIERLKDSIAREGASPLFLVGGAKSSTAKDVKLCWKMGEPPSKPRYAKCAIVKKYQ